MALGALWQKLHAFPEETTICQRFFTPAAGLEREYLVRMARALRIQAEGLTYHVWARGTGRMDIFLDDTDRQHFLQIFGRAFISHDVDCHAYCLMTNHYHVVVTTSGANLSHTIQSINSPYAQWWNRRHGRPGHVFQGRFCAQVIQDEPYLLTACRYVVLNPVRAGLVGSPGQWPWSSYRATAGLVDIGPFLRPDALWYRLGANHDDVGPANYREFVEKADPSADAPPREPVIGDAEFVQRFEHCRESADTEVPKRSRRVRPRLEDLFRQAFTLEDRAVRASGAHEAGYSLKEIGGLLGVHYTTVSKMISRATQMGAQP